MESDKHELFMDLATLGFSPCLSRKRVLWTLRKAAKSERTLTFPSARLGKCSMDKTDTSKIEAIRKGSFLARPRISYRPVRALGGPKAKKLQTSMFSNGFQLGFGVASFGWPYPGRPWLALAAPGCPWLALA